MLAMIMPNNYSDDKCFSDAGAVAVRVTGEECGQGKPVVSLAVSCLPNILKVEFNTKSPLYGC